MRRTEGDAGDTTLSPLAHLGSQNRFSSPPASARGPTPQKSIPASITENLAGAEQRTSRDEMHNEERAYVGEAQASDVSEIKQLQLVSDEELRVSHGQWSNVSPSENSGKAKEAKSTQRSVFGDSEAGAGYNLWGVVAAADGQERDHGIAPTATTGNEDTRNEIPGDHGEFTLGTLQKKNTAATIMKENKKETLDTRDRIPGDHGELTLGTLQNKNTAATIMKRNKKETLDQSNALPAGSSSHTEAGSSADVDTPNSTKRIPHFEMESAGNAQGDQRDAELPAFADTENVAIYDEIKEKQRILGRKEAEMGQKAERVALMRQHLQQLRAEAAQLEALSSAKASHISSDRHMQGIAIRQASKLKGEARQQQEQQEELQNRLTGLQVDIARGQEEIDCFKLRMKWSEEELAQWRSAALQKEEDLKVVGEFKRQDDARAAELIAQTQRASFEVAEVRRHLREEETASRAARAELQRSIEQFSEHQKDRALLIAQGERAVQEMWRVDNRIDRLTKTYAKVQEAVHQQLEKLASAQGFAKREELQNKALRGEITSAEQQLRNSRERSFDANAAVTQLAEQVARLRGQLSAAASRCKAAKRQLAELHENLADERQRLDGLRKKKNSVEKRLAREKQNFRSAGEAGEASEVFHTRAAARLQQLQQQVKASRDSLFEVLQRLTEEKAALKLKRGRLSSSKNALRNLQAQLQQHEAERSRQQELLYSIDFQCQAMQRRLTLASGYKTAAEAKTLQTHIKELQAESASQQEEQSALSEHIKQLESELRKAQRSLTKVDAEESRCATGVEEIRLACISLDKELHTALQEKEELVLAESLRKLEVNKLHEELEACADASLEAENQKLQKHLHAQAVLGAVDSELDAIKRQLRAAEEERHKLAKETSERRAKLAGLESRFENLLQSSQAIDGNGRSQAYYVIKAGQEREELQRLSAAVHRRLQTASVEVEGLEATVRDVRACNARLRLRLQSQTSTLTALRGEKEEKENLLFLRKHLTFTQYQQIEALKKATELKQKSLEEAKTTHQAVLNGLEVAEGERNRLQSQSCLLEDKLSRTLQQLEEAHANIQERRTSTSTTEPDGRENNPEYCNAEMRCHAESLRALLQSLYAEIG
ncbi:hypothetical protein Esti_001799 [Eimeria stiedai]